MTLHLQIEIDFGTLHGTDKSDSLVSAYPQFRKDVLAYVQRKVAKDGKGKDSVTCVKDIKGKEIVKNILKHIKDVKTYEGKYLGKI